MFSHDIDTRTFYRPDTATELSTRRAYALRTQMLTALGSVGLALGILISHIPPAAGPREPVHQALATATFLLLWYLIAVCIWPHFASKHADYNNRISTTPEPRLAILKSNAPDDLTTARLLATLAATALLVQVSASILTHGVPALLAITPLALTLIPILQVSNKLKAADDRRYLFDHPECVYYLLALAANFFVAYTALAAIF